MTERIVLAYSGDLDTSVAIPWLAERHGAEVVAVTLDLGQETDLEEVRGRAVTAGAIRAHVLDVRDEFAAEYILPALKAGAVYDGRYPMAAALGRPLIARKLVEVAGIEHAATVAHGSGAAGSRSDFDMLVHALKPDIRVLAPTWACGMSDADKLEYARARHLSVAGAATRPFRVNSNMWGRSIEGEVLADPRKEPPEGIYAITRSQERAPDTPAYADISFERGVPVAVNGVAMRFVELIESLTTIAGGHGVGRIDVCRSRAMESRERGPAWEGRRMVCEAPAAIVLHAAHQDLESFVSPREHCRSRQDLSAEYVGLIDKGLWFTPVRDALDASNAAVQERVTGVIRVKLFKGACTVVGRNV